MQLWIRWNQETPDRTRSTMRTFIKTTDFSRNIDDTYDIASVHQDGTTTKLLSTGNIEKARGSNEHTNDWAIGFLTLLEDSKACFAEQVKAHKGQTAGDGSCKVGRATGGFLSFEDDNIHGGIQGATEVPLSKEDCTPYSRELGGIQVAIVATHKVCTTHGVTSGTITHGVDNNAALQNCFGDEEPDTQTPCFHMVKRI